MQRFKMEFSQNQWVPLQYPLEWLLFKDKTKYQVLVRR